MRDAVSARCRFRVRTLLLLVAIVGLSLGLGIEWLNRIRRDQALRKAAFGFKKAEWHEQELAKCRAHIDANQIDVDPYDPTRAENNGEGRWTDFRSWAEEAKWHAEYAPLYRHEAERAVARAREIQRRLLLP